MLVKKEYIGDGVYAEYDGYHVVLTAENGDVVAAFERYIAKVKREIDTHNDNVRIRERGAI